MVKKQRELKKKLFAHYTLFNWHYTQYYSRIVLYCIIIIQKIEQQEEFYLYSQNWIQIRFKFNLNLIDWGKKNLLLFSIVGINIIRCNLISLGTNNNVTHTNKYNKSGIRQILFLSDGSRLMFSSSIGVRK